MVNISIRAQIEPTLKAMDRLQLEQAPFAVRWTVNALARDVVQATKNNIQQRFRASPQGLRFLQMQVRVLHGDGKLSRIHAPQGGFDRTMSAIVGVIPPEGKGQFAGWNRYRGSLLPGMEEGGRTPGPRDFGGMIGLGRYWIPERRPTDRTPIPMRLFPINLGLQARRSIEGGLGRGQLKGKQRTFLLKTREGHATIFQRHGRDRDAITPLYHTHPQAQLPARRYFYPTALRIVELKFALHFRAAMRQAVFGRGSYRG
jgi:hypothetical protein